MLSTKYRALVWPIVSMTVRTLSKVMGVPAGQTDFALAATRGILTGQIPEKVCKPLHATIFTFANALKDCKITPEEMRKIGDAYRTRTNSGKLGG